MIDTNRLDKETSPYLLQHKDNPVNWQPWDDAALKAAREADKPILLSVGYAACHWCHVMAHESFENPEIATLMNENFINIKVDREERPDLDMIYQRALALLGGHGGWPLTMFLTPKGEPFWGGTYFPPAPRFGQPGFPQVLMGVAQIYSEETDKVSQNVKALRGGLQRLSEEKIEGAFTPELMDEAAMMVLQSTDMKRGGSMGAPKFPQTTEFEFLWHAHMRTGKDAFRDAVRVTLDNMCQGGIYDHLGGGFARYATDANWLVPHFEKMLYDNALLVHLLSTVWLKERDPWYAKRVEETIEWVLRDMIAPDGGFASTLDADSEGEEGKYYVWTEEEIDGLLDEKAARVFKQTYSVTSGGNWEGKTILNRTGTDMPPSPDKEDASLAKSREILLKQRYKRIPPERDDKVLADWNGLMIDAMAEASMIFERPDWLDAAIAAYDVILKKLADGDRLKHSYRNGEAKHAGSLDDYATMASAALRLYECTGEPAYLDQAKSWVAVLDEQFWDGVGGGYFFTASDVTDVIERTKTAMDTATPAGNGIMARVLAKLYHLTGDEDHRARATELITAFTGAQAERLLYMPSVLMGFEMLENARQIVILPNKKEGQSPVKNALFHAAWHSPSPLKTINLINENVKLSKAHPAAGKTAEDGKTTAYVCRGTQCGLPVTDPAALQEDLQTA